LPRHYAGCVCNVQARKKDRRHKRVHRYEVFPVLAL
jgi:hypothetical protein